MSSKESIKLREKKLNNGNLSLYLDIYRNGKREYEFLKLYLIPEKTRADKEKNRQTRQLAEAIKAKRLVSLQNNEFGFKDSFREDILFYEYFEAMCEKRLGSKGNWGNWRSCLNHLQEYHPNKKLTFKDITPQWIDGFKDYLNKRATCWCGHKGLTKTDRSLSQNSKQSYFNKLRACLNQAFEERVIAINPIKGIDTIKTEESKRVYLTLEEVQSMANTPCRHEGTKQAFLFSCLTGIRRSDLEKMTWSEIHQQGEFTRIIFTQKKTKGIEYLDISPQAVGLLGKRGKPKDLVFNIIATSSTNTIIKLWAAKAGIEKDLTFHCARHTFATLMLDLGTDIYTVSKLLGHKDISTTQIYAKVMDKNKQAAVTRIPNIFGDKSDDIQ